MPLRPVRLSVFTVGSSPHPRRGPSSRKPVRNDSEAVAKRIELDYQAANKRSRNITVSTASTCSNSWIVSSILSSAISTICWISSIIAGQSKYGVDDGISGACDEPPDNVDIDPHLR